MKILDRQTFDILKMTEKQKECNNPYYTSDLTFLEQFFHTVNDDELYKIVSLFMKVDLSQTKKESMEQMKDYLQKVLLVDDTEMTNISKSYASLYTLSINANSPTSIPNKIAMIEKMFDFDKKENLAEFLKRNLNVLASSSDTLQQRLMLFAKFYSQQDLADNPYLMTIPLHKFKIRYMMSKICGVNSKSVLKLNEQCVFAKMSYLMDNGQPLFNAYASNASFYKKFGVEQYALIVDYPLDTNGIELVETLYAKNNFTPSTALKDREKTAILKDREKE